MRLYCYRHSPNCRKVLALVAQARIDLEIVEVDLPSGIQRMSEFRSINPNGKVPVLVDGDFVLWESNTIMRYLARRFQSDLFPSDIGRQASIERWMDWQLAQMSPVIDLIVEEELVQIMHQGSTPKPRAVTLPYRSQSLTGAREVALQLFSVLETALEHSQFLAGEEFSLADLSVAATLSNAESAKIRLSSFPAVTRWRQRVSRHPSWIASIPPDEIEVAVGIQS